MLGIIIEEGINKPYKCHDGFFLRIGPNAQKLKRDEIIQFINNVGKIHFDEAINGSFNYSENFSSTALQDYLKKCQLNLNATDENILLSLNLAETKKIELQITNAAVLFFAKEPQRFFPESYITAIKYQSNDRFSILDKKDFSGSPITQIEDSMQFVLRHTNAGTQFNPTKTGASEIIYDYPPIAIREAIINAVTHRDYLYDGSHIYIHIYPDHIDIESPGGLYHGLTVDDLGKRSVRRNRLIADLLHRAHYIERIGSGFDRMKNALIENHNLALEVTATNFFNIRFYKRAAQFDLRSLTHRQLMIYHAFLDRKILTKVEVSTLLKTSEDTAVRELKKLIELNLIQKQGEGKSTNYHLIVK